MDEQQQARPASANAPLPQKRPYVPYQRATQHISQEPITDPDLLPRLSMPAAPDNVSAPARPHSTRRAAPGHAPQGGARKHMGVATSDPQYLEPVAGVPGAIGPAHPRHKNPGDGEPQTLHYDRYLSTPDSRKTIFTARQERSRKRTHALLVITLVFAVAFLIWFALVR